MERCILLLLSAALALPAAAQTQAMKCPAGFEAFLQRFESEPRFQVAHVRFPLPITFIDDGYQKKDRLSKLQYTKPRQPWYPTPSLQADWQLRKMINAPSATRRIVHFEQADPETYSVDFHFQKAGACWRLMLMDDRTS